MDTSATLATLTTTAWTDYELLDTGDGAKLERFGAFKLVRPEIQAMWQRALPAADWQNVHAIFRPTGEESGGHWEMKRQMPVRSTMKSQCAEASGNTPRCRPGVVIAQKRSGGIDATPAAARKA